MQEEKGYYGYYKLEKQALSLLIAGPTLWLLGSILNSCQIYERAGGHMQILQQSVHIPFLIASLLFLVGSILNITAKEDDHTAALVHHSFRSLLVYIYICTMFNIQTAFQNRISEGIMHPFCRVGVGYGLGYAGAWCYLLEV